MSTLISYGETSETQADDIANNGFWPTISPAEFRANNRIDASVSPERVAFALRTAITSINAELAEWQTYQTYAGHADIDQVAKPAWAIEDHYQHLYQQAVYSTAHALILERYRDHSATGDVDESGDAKELATNTHTPIKDIFTELI